MRSLPKPSTMLSRPLCAAALLIATIPLAACSDTIVSTPRASCAILIPQSWRTPVPPEPIPQTDGSVSLATVQAWAAGFIGQTGVLEKQAGRTVDAIAIMERCEALVNTARTDG